MKIKTTWVQPDVFETQADIDELEKLLQQATKNAHKVQCPLHRLLSTILRKFRSWDADTSAIPKIS